MFKPADMSLWRGRIDSEPNALRYHQIIQQWDGADVSQPSTAILGFACDEGVRRNQGRVGAKEGPDEIRHALCNLAWHHAGRLLDGGDVICDSDQLAQTQQQLADRLFDILEQSDRAIVLGGGHEMAWGSFLGLTQHLEKRGNNHRVGIINLDAHFDLRAPSPTTTSGTPFHQIATWCEQHRKPFSYMVLGLSPVANTKTLFEFAHQHNVEWHSDTECNASNFSALHFQLEHFIKQIDQLYFTICLDVFAPNIAPGVSAPASIGIEPRFALQLIDAVKALCNKHHVEWQLSDIAELNPTYDLNGSTARLAARLVDTLI